MDVLLSSSMPTSISPPTTFSSPPYISKPLPPPTSTSHTLPSTMATIHKLLAVLLVALVTVAPRTEAAVSCGQVFSLLTPCLSYLTMGGPCPPACCSGVGNLNAAAQSTPDRQTVCGCLKTAASGVAGINLSRAAGLPNQCGVKIPYKLSPSTDCSKVR